MSTPDENTPGTGEDRGEPKTAGQAAMEEALSRSGRTVEDLTRPDEE
ncbi:hypothetical protein [Nonomuraea indica]|uniref:Uncharacterized protein n=1 Tax=Nonomuraea indica TaxID=1581193 RepID=A0ABW7ZWG1_9ACTN